MSSENSHDPFKDIIAYDPSIFFSDFKFHFLIALEFGNYSDILDGTENSHDNDKFDARNRTIYRVLVKSIGKCPREIERGIATGIMQQIENRNAW